MISIHTATISQLIKDNFLQDVGEQAIALKTQMEKFLIKHPSLEPLQKDYVRKIIKLHEQLIIATPKQLESYKKTFDQSIDHKHMGTDLHKNFRDNLISYMGYSDKRSSFYPQYFRKIGIKSCVYCNSQLTISVDADFYDKQKKGEGKTIRTEAKFQVDHFINKGQYPCFSISLLNLYPVCGTCNLLKSQNPISFRLYNDDTKKKNSSNYVFSLEEKGLTKYLNEPDPSHLEIIFTDPDKKEKDKFGEGSLADNFDIAAIYQTQLDIVEEMILKHRIYNGSYSNALIQAFPKLFNHSNLSERIRLGNYHLPEDIHKRPLAKFMQDIDRQLSGIIEPNSKKTT